MQRPLHLLGVWSTSIAIILTFAGTSTAIDIPEDADCCGWNHVSPSPSPSPSPVLSPSSLETHAKTWPDPNDYDLKDNDPAYITDYLRLRPEIDEKERLRISRIALAASPDTHTGNTLLWLAVEAGQTPVLAALLKDGANPLGHDGYKAPTSRTLVAASRRGDVETVRLLVEAGLDPDMDLSRPQDVRPGPLEPEAEEHLRDNLMNLNYTPMTIAVEKNHTALVGWLLQTGRIKLSNPVGYAALTYLDMAAEIGHLPTFTVLLEHYNVNEHYGRKAYVGGSTNARFDVRKLLRQAANSGDLRIVEAALRRLGLDLEKSSPHVTGTPLTEEQRVLIIFALRGACGGQAPISLIRHLLDLLRLPGQDEIPELNALDQALWHGRMTSVSRRQHDVFAFLVRLEERRIRQQGNWTAQGAKQFDKILHESLMWALDLDDADAFRYVVEEEGIDPFEKSEYYLLRHHDDGSRPELIFDNAVWRGSYAVARYLLESKRPDTSEYNLFGSWTTPLSTALGGPRTSAGKDPQIKKGQDPQDRERVVRLLLEAGGPVSAISPPTVPDFQSKRVVVDVIGSPFGKETKVCLCWGYEDSIRPKPVFDDKHVVRLGLGEEDEAWWANLKKMAEKPLVEHLPRQKAVEEAQKPMEVHEDL